MDLSALERQQYDSALQSPQQWLLCAWRLRRAAQEIDTFSLPGFSNGPPDGPRGEIALLMPVYRFLMAQSFENLLKGLLIAQGHSAGKSGCLDKSFKTHSLGSLAGKVDKTQFPLVAEERELLHEMQQFTTWAGRYPIPTGSNLYKVAMAYSSTQHAKEAKLWDRVATYIKKNVPTASSGSPEGGEVPVDIETDAAT